MTFLSSSAKEYGAESYYRKACEIKVFNIKRNLHLEGTAFAYKRTALLDKKRHLMSGG